MKKILILLIFVFSLFSVYASADYPYDIANATYSGVNLSVFAQDSSTTGSAFNNDGSKLFMVGIGTDTVYEYNCTTDFKIDTCIYSTRSLSVSGQDTQPYGIGFNNNGSKLFIVGSETDSIYEYNCTTDFKIDTCSYSTINLSVTSQDTAPKGADFNNDGSKLFMVGSSSDSAYEYNCTTDFKIDTCIYSTRSIDLSSQTPSPQGLEFNNNGSKLFTVGFVTNAIYEYNCTTDFKIDTCIYTTRSLDLSNQDTQSFDLSFNNDGSKLFMVGSVTDSIYEYDIDVSTDSCTPPAINNDWIINSTDNCDIQNQTIDLGTGGIYFTDSGNITFNNINLTSSFFERLLDDIGTDTQVYLYSTMCTLI